MLEKDSRSSWLLRSVRILIDLAVFLRYSGENVFLNELMVLNILSGSFQLIVRSLLKESHFLILLFQRIIYIFEAGSHSTAQAGLQVIIPLCQAFEGRDCKHTAVPIMESFNSFTWGGKILSFSIHLNGFILSCSRGAHFGINGISCYFMKNAVT